MSEIDKTVAPLMSEKPVPFSAILKEAIFRVWPWTMRRQFGEMKITSKRLKGGRTKLTLSVEVYPQ